MVNWEKEMLKHGEQVTKGPPEDLNERSPSAEDLILTNKNHFPYFEFCRDGIPYGGPAGSIMVTSGIQMVTCGLHNGELPL